MAVRESERRGEDPNDPIPSVPDGASISGAQTFDSPDDGTRTYSDDTLRNTTNSNEADDRPRSALSSLADIERALPNSLAGSRRNRPTGLTIAPASPPLGVDDLPADFIYEAKDGRKEAAETQAADIDEKKTRGEGPSSAPRRSGVCKFFNAQKVCPSV